MRAAAGIAIDARRPVRVRLPLDALEDADQVVEFLGVDGDVVDVTLGRRGIRVVVVADLDERVSGVDPSVGGFWDCALGSPLDPEDVGELLGAVDAVAGVFRAQSTLSPPKRSPRWGAGGCREMAAGEVCWSDG